MKMIAFLPRLAASGIAALALLASAGNAFAATEVQRPDPARFQGEIDAFKSWESRNSVPAHAWLFLGSSSIRMWPTAEAFPNEVVVNRGFGGAWSHDLIAYFDEITQAESPEVIVLYVGDNDLADGVPPAEILPNMDKLLDKLAARYPDVPVLLLSGKISGSRIQFLEGYHEFNKGLQLLAKKHDGVTYVDVATPLLDKKGQPRDELFLGDRLHLNDKGYALWRAAVLTSLPASVK